MDVGMEQVKKLIEVLKGKGKFNIDDMEAAGDEGSILLLSAKVNALFNVFLKDESDAKHQEFIDEWARVYEEMATRKRNTFLKIFEDPDILSAFGIDVESESDMEAVKEMIIKPMKDVIDQTGDSIQIVVDAIKESGN